MSERGIEVKVGILVTVCIGLLVVFVLALGDFTKGGRAKLYVDLPSSGDLNPGAPVEVAGVHAGKVEAIHYRGGEMDEEAGHRVWVRAELSIRPEMLRTLHEDARFYLTTQGVLGEMYVAVEPGSPDTPKLEPDAVVVGEPPMDLQRVAGDIQDLVRTVDRIVQDNEKAIEELIVESRDTVKAIRGLAERADGFLAKHDETIGEFVERAVGLEKQAEDLLASANHAIGDGSSLRRTIAHAESLGRQARSRLDTLGDDVQQTLKRYRSLATEGEKTLVDVRGEADKLLGRAQDAVDDVATLTARIREGEGSLGALLQDRELYDDVREMMKDLKRHPWKFLWKE